VKDDYLEVEGDINIGFSRNIAEKYLYIKKHIGLNINNNDFGIVDKVKDDTVLETVQSLSDKKIENYYG